VRLEGGADVDHPKPGAATIDAGEAAAAMGAVMAAELMQQRKRYGQRSVPSVELASPEVASQPRTFAGSFAVRR
jgi:hypothetical protein